MAVLGTSPGSMGRGSYNGAPMNGNGIPPSAGMDPAALAQMTGMPNGELDLADSNIQVTPLPTFDRRKFSRYTRIERWDWRGASDWLRKILGSWSWDETTTWWLQQRVLKRQARKGRLSAGSWVI